MTGRLSPQAEREIDDLVRELRSESPLLAHRLESVVDQIKTDVPQDADDFVSTGEAAAALNVSVNTVKKWVRVGIIRDFWTLPGSGYLKIARAEIERIRAEGAPSYAEGPEA